jgi:hypothetical protein
MKDLPSFETFLVPSGFYEAEVIEEIQEKTSSFDKNKTYLELAFALKNPQWGDFSRFVWAFTPRSPKFGDFLAAIGGTRLPNGNINPPRGPYVGKKVMINVTQRISKADKTKIVNEVLTIMPVPVELPEDDGIKIPF